MGKKGSTLGSILLVTGCSIGAGMLGLPVLSSLAGFQPSLLMLFVAWIFMCTTGLLLLEVNLWFKEEVSIVTMAERTLGVIGKAAAWVLFLLLFYSAMVAYVAACGDLFSDFSQDLAGIDLPKWVGSLIFTVLFGVFIYLGTFFVDELNRFLMIGLVVTYLILVIIGFQYVNPELLRFKDWDASLYILPGMVVMFGFQNLVPSLTIYLEHDRKRLIRTLIIGSFIPFLIYIVWQALILGLVPIEGEGGFRHALGRGEMATHVLRLSVGKSWVVQSAQYFAFFAIITSFLSVALSFVDFLADGLHVHEKRYGKALLCLLTLLPPLAFALSNPSVFLSALEYAGFIAMILFGIMPALMVWVVRYKFNFKEEEVIPGGRIVLALVILFSLLVIALLLKQKLYG